MVAAAMQLKRAAGAVSEVRGVDRRNCGTTDTTRRRRSLKIDKRYLAEVIRIALADGPLSEPERQAALAIGVDLGMTQAQVIGVVAMTEQSSGCD
jgi:hypothetical protein